MAADRSIRAHRAETESGPIDLVFRDRTLSDRIGFTYARWEPRDGRGAILCDAIHAVRRASVPRAKVPIVTVILDGENCWESYEEDGIRSCEELYRMLDADPEIEAVTVSEALARTPHHIPTSTRSRSDRGSATDLASGSGTRRRIARGTNSAALATAVLRPPRRDRGRAAAALEEVYAAEASDWFWWYGDDHRSVHREMFDRLFRARLLHAYRCLASSRSGLLAPESSRGRQGGDAGTGETPWAPSKRAPRSTGARPISTSGVGLLLYEPAGGSGSMHQASAVIRAIRYGLDGRRPLRARGLGSRPRSGKLRRRDRYRGPPEGAARVAVAIQVGRSRVAPQRRCAQSGLR